MENPVKYKAECSLPPHIPTLVEKLNISFTESKYSAAIDSSPKRIGIVTNTDFGGLELNMCFSILSKYIFPSLQTTISKSG